MIIWLLVEESVYYLVNYSLSRVHVVIAGRERFILS